MPGLNLEQASGEVARNLVIAQACAARTAYAALCKGEDPEALHDLRVALRRMRSLLRAYRAELRLRKRIRRELNELAAATNPARDAEVLLELYSGLPLPTAREAKAGVAWAGMRLRDETASGARAARLALDAELESLCRHVERGLEFSADGQQTTWRTALSNRLEMAWVELDAELQALRDEFSMARAHHARIEVKRLRYLLEPVRAVLEPAKSLVQESKRLQTLLGDLHDAQVFAEWLMGAASVAGARWGRAELVRTLDEDVEEPDEAADAMPGLVYLGETVCERERALADEVKAWLAGDGLQGLGEAMRVMREAL
jgi:CHAD domain-containing protein